MKTAIAIRIFALLAIIAFASAASDFQNAVKCGRRFPRINQAIEIFCTKLNKDGKPTNDIMVPSTYAQRGVGTTGLKGNKLYVGIAGNCATPQWVPEQWCKAQFHDLCANTRDRRGWNWRAHGKGGCQKFKIQGRSDAAYMFGPREFTPIGMPRVGKLRGGH
ncbi:hypothetical protein Q7P37_002656 [Cladosporium fusiforme]